MIILCEIIERDHNYQTLSHCNFITHFIPSSHVFRSTIELIVLGQYHSNIGIIHIITLTQTTTTEYKRFICPPLSICNTITQNLSQITPKSLMRPLIHRYRLHSPITRSNSLHSSQREYSITREGAGESWRGWSGIWVLTGRFLTSLHPRNHQIHQSQSG